MNTIGTKLAAVVLAASALGVFAPSSAFAGKGGSAALISAAVQSGSQDAIIAEVERTEGLMCPECVQTVTNLTEDSRFPVREVAAWWFAKRPQLKELMAQQMMDDLKYGDALHVRNAADFLGAVVEYTSLPALRVAITRGDLSTDAKLAIVRAVGYMAHISGNGILQTAMADRDAAVRAAAVVAWRDVLGQMSVTPVEPLLADGDATVRAQAATVLGAYGDGNVRATLEQLVVSDKDPVVRRNAAWALGKIGSIASRPALLAASSDSSGRVSGVAKAALATLK
jgi:HEAT repeat protein